MERSTVSQKFPIGSKMPGFSLPSTSGDMVGNEFFNGSVLSLIVFTCNHCPYVMGSEEMLLKTVGKFEKQGLRTITISSNDVLQYPVDGPDKMAEKASAMNLPYPYLYDETQEVAKLFDAECTPEFFLFDKNNSLIYHGTINDSPRDPSKATKNYLATAIEQALKGQAPDPSFVHPLGCSIKWKR